MTKQSPRRRLERLQGTLMKLVANLESCKLLLLELEKQTETHK